jgi:hypothetical protein
MKKVWNANEIPADKFQSKLDKLKLFINHQRSER